MLHASEGYHILRPYLKGRNKKNHCGGLNRHILELHRQLRVNRQVIVSNSRKQPDGKRRVLMSRGPENHSWRGLNSWSVKSSNNKNMTVLYEGDFMTS